MDNRFNLIRYFQLLGLDELTKAEKRIMRRHWKEPTDVLATRQSGMLPWRTTYDKNDPCGYYIWGIFPYAYETDDEIQEWVDAMAFRVNSPYDCTGKPFTRWIHWSVQPCGIVVVHAVGIDV